MHLGKRWDPSYRYKECSKPPRHPPTRSEAVMIRFGSCMYEHLYDRPADYLNICIRDVATPRFRAEHLVDIMPPPLPKMQGQPARQRKRRETSPDR